MTEHAEVVRELGSAFEGFLDRYYSDAVGELAQAYPQDQDRLVVDYQDIVTFDVDLADDVLTHPKAALAALNDRLVRYDLPIAVDLSGAEVVLSNLPERHTVQPGELRAEHGDTYVAVRGVLERVTVPDQLPERITFECQRCGVRHDIPQDPTEGDLIEPHECKQCDRQGPFEPLTNESEWADFAKLRFAPRPDATESGAVEGTLEGHAVDSTLDYGGGLVSRAGEPVTAYGIAHRTQKDGRNQNTALFELNLELKHIEFDRDRDTIDVAEHRERFEDIAASGTAIEQFAASIAPELHETDAWEVAMEFAVAYLFGATRIDIPNGPTYRGDLHGLIISDYGMGKSTFKEDIEAYSPKCISKSTTALSSGVGLTAAAVKDDFGEGQWTVKPGLLVRANGGHLILDEIDKGPVDSLTDMNDALEGSQVVDIEKAGQSATYQSRAAVLAMGNPENGRFNPHDAIAEQIEIPESLLSRMDAIITMQDVADETLDSKVAERWGRAYTEAQQVQSGERDEMDVFDRPVPVDVGRAWVEYARENVTPTLHYEQFNDLETWYAEEVRQLNSDSDGGQVVPATARELAAAVRMAVAFARCELVETVCERHIDRAKHLGRKLVGQNWDGEQFDAAVTRGATTQRERIDTIKQAIEQGATTPAEVAEQTGIGTEQARHDIDQLKQKGELYEPQNGELRPA